MISAAFFLFIAFWPNSFLRQLFDPNFDPRRHRLRIIAIFLLLKHNTYRILRQWKGAVGVFRFQGCLHHFTVDPEYLPQAPEVTPFPINVLPLEAEEFSLLSPAASSR